MASAVQFRVLGALGPDLSDPLLAEALDAEGQVCERVVLDRVRPLQPQRDVQQLGSAMAVTQRRVVQVEQGTWAVVPFVPGLDLVDLRDRHPDGVPEREALTLLADVLWILRRVAEGGQHHGGLGGGSVRIGPDGVVRVLGWRGGTEADDCQALADLYELLCGAEGENMAKLDAWPSTLDGVAERLVTGSVSLRAWVGPILDARPATLVDHPLGGVVLAEVDTHGRLPDKVRLAAVGAVTLLLGIAISYFLTGARL